MVRDKLVLKVPHIGDDGFALLWRRWLWECGRSIDVPELDVVQRDRELEVVSSREKGSERGNHVSDVGRDGQRVSLPHERVVQRVQRMARERDRGFREGVEERDVEP